MNDKVLGHYNTCVFVCCVLNRNIGADYYTANGHKWFLTPKVSKLYINTYFRSSLVIYISICFIGLYDAGSKGCAVLYVNKSRQDIIHPLVLSWGHDLGFYSEFVWSGEFQKRSTFVLLIYIIFNSAI